MAQGVQVAGEDGEGVLTRSKFLNTGVPNPRAMDQYGPRDVLKKVSRGPSRVED